MINKYRCPKYCSERRSIICHTLNCETWKNQCEIRETVKENKEKGKQAAIYLIKTSLDRNTHWLRRTKKKFIL